MKPKEVTIIAEIIVEGEMWPVSLRAEVKADKYNILLADIKNMILKMKEAGFIMRHLDRPPARQHGTGKAPNEESSAAFTWPPPVCPDCTRAMRVSNHQKDTGLISYFCSNTLPMGGYCKQCASVSNVSGGVNHYVVKK